MSNLIALVQGQALPHSQDVQRRVYIPVDDQTASPAFVGLADRHFLDMAAAGEIGRHDMKAIGRAAEAVNSTHCVVVIARPPVDAIGHLDLAQPAVRRIAIANPDHAPYGIAAREALQSAGLWDALQPKLILGENVRQTLQYAETGDVDVAIAALSLSRQEQGRWALVPEALHAPIDQALAVVAGSRHEAAARAFAAYVNSPAGRAIMQRYGFVLPGEEVTP